MTEEQKNRRAELARENGRKSRGPISPLGKYASSMNAITTGKHVNVHKEVFPECDTLYSTDERESFVRLHLKHVRQYKPHAECEHAIVRQMTTELFDYQRACDVETLAVQRNLDSVLREHPEVSVAEQLLQGFHRAATSEDKTKGCLAADWVFDGTGGGHRLARWLSYPVWRFSSRLIARFGYVDGVCDEPTPSIRKTKGGWTWVAEIGPGRFQWTTVSRLERHPKRPTSVRGREVGMTRGADVT